MSTIIRGKTVEEKFVSLEKVLQNFRRRLSTKVVGLLPPVVISHSQQIPCSGGLFFSSIIPLNGVCVRVCVGVGNYLEREPIVYVDYASSNKSASLEYTLKESVEVITTDFPVHVGDVLRMRVMPANAIEQILVSLLVIPELHGQVRQEQYLLDQLLHLEEIEDAESNG